MKLKLATKSMLFGAGVGLVLVVLSDFGLLVPFPILGDSSKSKVKAI